MRRQGVCPSRVTYTAAVAGLNRPRYAEWGPQLERVVRLLQQSADVSRRERSYQRREDRRRATGTAGTRENMPQGDGVDTGVAGRDGVKEAGDGIDTSNGSENDVRNAVNRGPSTGDFDGSIKALGDAGHADGAASLLRVMRQEGFHASPRAYRSVIYACARVGLLSEAVALAKEMQTESKSAIVYTSMNLMASVQDSNDDDEYLTEDDVDQEDYDLATMYNCIVCNFARAAASGALDEPGVTGRRGKDEHSSASATRAVETPNERGLVSLLMRVTERAEGLIGEEASGAVGLIEGSSASLAPAAAAVRMATLT